MAKWKYFSEAEFVWNGEWNDSELIYKGHTINSNIILDTLWERFNDYAEEKMIEANEQNFEIYCEYNQYEIEELFEIAIEGCLIECPTCKETFSIQQWNNKTKEVLESHGVSIGTYIENRHEGCLYRCPNENCEDEVITLKDLSLSIITDEIQEQMLNLILVRTQNQN